MKPTFLESMSCPGCGAIPTMEAACRTRDPVLCPACRLKRGLERQVAAGPGEHYCGFCERPVARAWRRRHEQSKEHLTHARLVVAAAAGIPAERLVLESA